jgi:putative FmdB family regulatory protein
MTPVYVYECDSCENTFEVVQSFTEDVLTKCKKCAGKLHRVIQPSPIIWKTAGSYTSEKHGLQGRKRKPEIKVGNVSDLPKEDQERSKELLQG